MFNTPTTTSTTTHDYANNNSQQNRPPLWRINSRETEGLLEFGGDGNSYRSWTSRVRDHAAEEWPEWRTILDNVEKPPTEWRTDQLAQQEFFGVNAQLLNADLW